MTLELRPYQVTDFGRLRNAFAIHRSVLYVGVTGSGKTVLSAEIIRSALARNNQCLFLAGRTELLDQTAAKLALAGITDVRVIQAERDTGNSAARVTVASIQTLTTDRWSGKLPAAQFVILDEAHHGPAGSWAAVMRAYAGARWLGLSGSPMRAQGQPLGDLFQTMVIGPSVADLTALGHLVPCLLLVPPRDAALSSKLLAMDPVAAYLAHGGGGLATVFCRDVAHARATAADFCAAGIPSAHVDGRMSEARRRAVLADLAAGRIRVMPSVDVVTEGFDLPALSVAIMARKFGHVGRWIQAIGRVLRPAPGKTLARVIDLVGSAHDHGPPDAPREYTLDGDGIAPMTRLAFKTCRECHAMFVAADACRHCGAPVPVSERDLPRAAGMELEELEPKVTAVRREWVVEMASKRRGVCASCGGSIGAGDPILWATLARAARHRRCPVAVAA